MKEPDQTQNPLQIRKLEKLAKRLILNDIKPRVRAVKMESTVFKIRRKFVRDLPVFFGPISQLPRIFPYQWSFNGENYYWVEDDSQSTLTSLRFFFGLNWSMIAHIFIPEAQSVNMYGGSQLTAHSTSKDVAWNIIQLILSQKIGEDFELDRNTFFSAN